MNHGSEFSWGMECWDPSFGGVDSHNHEGHPHMVSRHSASLRFSYGTVKKSYPAVTAANARMGGCQNYGPFLDPYHNTALNT